jgi:hypothetical protein
LTASAGLAAADPLSACSTTAGVVVAVNFSTWGGDVERGCDATATTGLDALEAAGFAPVGVAEFGLAAICQLTDPATNPPIAQPAGTSCASMPPASAYWSLWYAEAGTDTWSYSQQGAMSYRPQPGSVEAWTFGATDIAGTTGQPPFPPSAVLATNIGPPVAPTTVPTTPATAAPTLAPVVPPSRTIPAATTTLPAPPPVVPTTAAPEPLPASTTSPPSTSPSTVKPAPTTSTSLAPTTTTSTTSTVPPPPTPKPGGKASAGAGGSSSARRDQAAPRIVNVAPASAHLAPHRASSGSPLPLIVGAVVAAVLAGSGGFVAWRRRRIT